MREIRFRATGLSEEGFRRRRIIGDRPPTRAKAAGLALVGLAALYLIGVGKLTGRVDIISPASGFTTLDAQIPVSGRATDLGSDNVTLNVNGSLQTLPAPGGLFDVEVSLAPGENTIIASANDVSSEPITIIRKLAPVVRIDSPRDNTAVTQSQIELSGTVENRGDRAVTLEVNGTTQAVAVMGEQFTATLPLEEGRNTIRALVPDAAPAVVVVLLLETDIAITHPLDGSTLEQETVNVTGIVNNSNAAAITLKLNESRQTIAVRNGFFASNIRLRVGENRIQALLGDNSSNEVVVNRTPPPVIITLTSPQSGSTLSQVSSVRGTIQNARGNRVTLRVNASEQVVQVTAGGFKAEVPLETGINVIRASQGEAISNEVVVNREPPSVLIQITSPKSGSTQNLSARVTGTITNPRGRTVTLTVNGSAHVVEIINRGFASEVKLEVGANRIQASQGEAVSNVITLRRFPHASIRIISPQSGQTKNSAVAVIGTVENATGDTITLTVNGAPRSVRVIDGRFRSDVTLIFGENLIEASVAGASDQITLVRPKVDPPKVRIIIDSPNNGEITGSRVLGVRGRVENAEPESITLNVNGKSFQVQTTLGVFQSKVTLTPGRNSIRASVGSASDEVEVILQVNDAPPDETPDECSKIDCDCKNVKATLSLAETWLRASVGPKNQPPSFFASSTGSPLQQRAQDRQARCRAAEDALKAKCKRAGKLTEDMFCPSGASGPDARPKPRNNKRTSAIPLGKQGVKKT